MNEKLEQIGNLIGRESLERVLEIMEMFGLSFPKSFEIYCKDWYTLNRKYPYSELKRDFYKSYAVILSDSKNLPDYIKREQLDELGCLEFDERHQILSFIRNGIFYCWEKAGKDHESLKISIGTRSNHENEMTVCFNRSNDGLLSSELWINGKYSSPVINSYIDKVKVKNSYFNVSEEVTIDEYYDFFVRLLEAEYFNYAIPNNLRSEQINYIIAQVFERTLNEFVDDIKNKDQSWRFDKEEELIRLACLSKKKSAEKERDDVINKANNLYRHRIRQADEEKDASLRDLAKQRDAYRVAQDTKFYFKH